MSDLDDYFQEDFEEENLDHIFGEVDKKQSQKQTPVAPAAQIRKPQENKNQISAIKANEYSYDYEDDFEESAEQIKFDLEKMKKQEKEQTQFIKTMELDKNKFSKPSNEPQHKKQNKSFKKEETEEGSRKPRQTEALTKNTSKGVEVKTSVPNYGVGVSKQSASAKKNQESNQPSLQKAVSKPALGFKPKTTRDDEDKTYTQKQSYTEKQSPVSVKRSAQPKQQHSSKKSGYVFSTIQQVPSNIDKSLIKPSLIETIDKKLKSDEDKYEMLVLSNQSPAFQALPDGKKFNYLQDENKQIRDEFKIINTYITQLLEYKNAEAGSTGKKRGNKRPGSEAREKIRVKEASNSQQSLQTAEKEYLKLSARLEQISDLNYMSNLKQEINKLNKYLKSVTRANKNYDVKQYLREKEMNKVISAGEVEDLNKINRMKQEICIIYERKSEVNDKEKDYNKLIKKLSQHGEGGKERMKKLMELARMYKVDVAKLERKNSLNSQESNRVKDYQKLVNKVANFQNRFTLEDKKIKMMRNEFDRDKLKVIQQIMEVEDKVEAKEEEIKIKQQELTAEISKAQSLDSSSLKKVLKEWENKARTQKAINDSENLSKQNIEKFNELNYKSEKMMKKSGSRDNTAMRKPPKNYKDAMAFLEQREKESATKIQQMFRKTQKRKSEAKTQQKPQKEHSPLPKELKPKSKEPRESIDLKAKQFKTVQQQNPTKLEPTYDKKDKNFTSSPNPMEKQSPAPAQPTKGEQATSAVLKPNFMTKKKEKKYNFPSVPKNPTPENTTTTHEDKPTSYNPTKAQESYTDTKTAKAQNYSNYNTNPLYSEQSDTKDLSQPQQQTSSTKKTFNFNKMKDNRKNEPSVNNKQTEKADKTEKNENEFNVSDKNKGFRNVEEDKSDNIQDPFAHLDDYDPLEKYKNVSSSQNKQSVSKIQQPKSFQKTSVQQDMLLDQDQQPTQNQYGKRMHKPQEDKPQDQINSFGFKKRDKPTQQKKPIFLTEEKSQPKKQAAVNVDPFAGIDDLEESGDHYQKPVKESKIGKFSVPTVSKEDTEFSGFKKKTIPKHDPSPKADPIPEKKKPKPLEEDDFNFDDDDFIELE